MILLTGHPRSSQTYWQTLISIDANLVTIIRKTRRLQLSRFSELLSPCGIQTAIKKPSKTINPLPIKILEIG
jgi:hypothetical protein